MFVKNFNNIKQKTLSVNEQEKNYLMSNGYSPLSKNENLWIYTYTDNILLCIEKYRNEVNKT